MGSLLNFQRVTVVAACLFVVFFAIAVDHYRDRHCLRDDIPATGMATGTEKAGIKDPFSCGVMGLPGATMAFVDANEGFFVALFTLALVISTIFLWRATADLYAAGERQIAAAQKSADAADRSSKAALARELPILKVRPPVLYGAAPADGGPRRPLSDIPGTSNKIFKFVADNHGRTVAILKELAIGWSADAYLPAEPDYKVELVFPGAEVIKEGQQNYDLYSTQLRIALDPQQVEALKQDRGTLRVFLKLDYEDFMGQSHTIRFCWAWDEDAGDGKYWFFPDDDVPPEYKEKT